VSDCHGLHRCPTCASPTLHRASIQQTNTRVARCIVRTGGQHLLRRHSTCAIQVDRLVAVEKGAIT